MAGVPEGKAPVFVDERQVRAAVDAGHGVLALLVLGLHVQERLVAVAEAVLGRADAAVLAAHALEVEAAFGVERPVAETRVKAAVIN